MRSGMLVVCAVAAALLTACSDGGDKGNTAGSGGLPEQTSVAAPKPTAFADFPGPSLVYLENGYKVGVQLKAIDSTWSGDALGTPADPGKHYLSVWVVTTPELADRGAEKVSLNKKLYLRYKPGKGGCEPASTGYCYAFGWPSSQLAKLDEGENWRTEKWEESEYVRTDFARGETRFGMIGFPVEDAVQATEFELCAPSREEGYTSAKFPCIPVKAPDGTR